MQSDERKVRGASPEQPGDQRVSASQNRIVKGFLFVLGLVALSAAATSLWNRDLSEATQAFGVLLIVLWAYRNIWFLHERPFDGNFFSRPGHFRTSELLVAGVLLALLPSILGE
jgi:hypothetical protein